MRGNLASRRWTRDTAGSRISSRPYTITRPGATDGPRRKPRSSRPNHVREDHQYRGRSSGPCSWCNDSAKARDLVDQRRSSPGQCVPAVLDAREVQQKKARTEPRARDRSLPGPSRPERWRTSRLAATSAARHSLAHAVKANWSPITEPKRSGHGGTVFGVNTVDE